MAANPKQVHLAKELSYSAPLINCRFDPSGKFLFVTAEDRSIIRWRLTDGNKVVFIRKISHRHLNHLKNYTIKSQINYCL